MKNVIEIADSFVGANSETKKKIIDYYNFYCVELVKPSRRYKMKYSDEWCAAFTSVVAHMANLENFPFEVSVREQVKIAKEWGTYYKGALKCKKGDLIIFDWLGNGGYDHVGFASRVTETHITTIEGNKSDSVGYRTTRRHSRVIRGVIELGYAEVNPEDERLHGLALRVLRGDFGVGFDRMDALGRDYEKVQTIVNNLLGEKG